MRYVLQQLAKYGKVLVCEAEYVQDAGSRCGSGWSMKVFSRKLNYGDLENREL